MTSPFTPATIPSGGSSTGGGQILGSTNLTSLNFTTASTTPVLITGAEVAVTVPSGGGTVVVTAGGGQIDNNTAGDFVEVTLWDGVVGSGTQLTISPGISRGANDPLAWSILASHVPAAGAHTYRLGLNAVVGGTAQIYCAAANTTGVSFVVMYFA